MDDYLIEVTEKLLDTLESVFDTVSQGQHHGLMCSVVAHHLGMWIEQAADPDGLYDDLMHNIDVGRTAYEEPTIN